MPAVMVTGPTTTQNSPFLPQCSNGCGDRHNGRNETISFIATARTTDA